MPYKNPADKVAQQRAYRLRNLEKMRAYHREYQAKWREPRREELRARDRKRVRNLNAAQRAKKNAANSAYGKRKRQKDGDAVREYSREHTRRWRYANRDKVNAALRTLRSNWSPEQKAHARSLRREWYARNRDTYLAKLREQHATNLQCRLSKILRDRLRVALNGKSKPMDKRQRIEALIGCTIDHLVSHLEDQFTGNMAWSNHGKLWHVDHKRPISAFDLTDPKQYLAATHWTNLQPLTAFENLSKGGVNRRKFAHLRPPG